MRRRWTILVLRLRDICFEAQPGLPRLLKETQTSIASYIRGS